MTDRNNTPKRPRVKDTKTFIEAARYEHGDAYNYDLVEYTRSAEKVTILCPEHGPFEQRPNDHLRPRGCPACGLTKQQKGNEQRCLEAARDFVTRAKDKHKDKYKYDLVDYQDSQTKVTIICLEHGPFEQRPSAHLNNQGCPECATIKQQKGNEQRRLEAARDFVARAKDKHKDKYKYDLADYQDSQTKVTILCPEHGPFRQTPTNHLNNHACPECGIKKTKVTHEQRRLEAARDFVAKANKKHKGKYKYGLVNYWDSRTKVTILCPEHGPFRQTPTNHLNNQGCPRCAREKTSGWSRSDFVRIANTRNGRARLYLIKCQDKKEQFYKIGITAKTTNERFKYSREMPYNYEIIKEITGEPGAIYDMETQFHRMNREHHYNPKKPFGGSALECFSEINPDALFLFDVL